MRRPVLLFCVCVAAMASGACGDPLVVLGDEPGTARIVAGIGDGAGAHIDTIATSSRFINLAAIAFDNASDVLFVGDRGASTSSNGLAEPVARIFSVTSAGRLHLELDAGACGIGHPICVAETTDLASGGPGIVLIADAIHHRVASFDVATHTLSNVAGTGIAVNAVEGAPAQTSGINGPAGILRAADGTLYISESVTGRILSVGASGTYHVIAGGGSQPVNTTPIAATTALLGSPAGLALSNGILYIADRDRNAVYALTLASGQLARIAGDGIVGFGGDEGAANLSRLAAPRDVAVSADGATLYIADSGNNRIRAITLNTNIIRTYFGSGSATLTNDRLAAGATSLSNPTGLAVSDLGYLFVADAGHVVIRRVAITF